MTWALLVFGVVALAAVVNALWSVRGFAPLIAGSFFAGWFVSEAPVHVLVFNLLCVAGAAASGGLVAWPGWVGLALVLIACVGLLRMVAHGRAAPALFDASLRGALGERSLQSVPPSRTRAPRGSLTVPLLLFDPRVKRWTNIPYGEQAGSRQLLDIYAPPGGARDAPVLFQIHGGAWSIGHKAQQARPLLFHMARAGWVCVSINYRLSPRARWPDHIVDVKRALAWVRANISEYGGDPDFVMVTGGSAGGHLSALAALTGNDPRWQPGFEQADTRVQAAAPVYGVYDFTNRAGTDQHGSMRVVLERYVLQASFRKNPELFEQASPFYRVSEDAPPFFVVHGRNDSLATVEDARQFVDALRARSEQPVAYAELPYTQHAFDVFNSLRSLALVRSIERFGRIVHRDYLQVRGPQRSGTASGAICAPGKPEQVNEL